MSKLTRYCLFTALAAGMALGFSARAEILVYDGFPTGSGAYPTADKSTIKSYGNALTTEKIVGFERQNWGSGTEVIYVFGNGTGLSLPDSFADLPSAVNIGSGSAGAYNSGQSDGERGVYRQLTSATVSAIRNARELHFRFLLSADAKALGALDTNSSTASLPGKSAFGAGLYLSASSAYGSYRNSNAKTARSIGFAIRRVKADCFKLCLVIVGAEDSFTTEGQVRVYDLVESVTAGATYLCYARIDVNAGADGKEQIQAFAQDVSDYDPSALLCDAVEANLIDDAGTGAPNSLNFAAGSYMTNGGYFKVDEFALATAAEDIMFLGKAGVSRLKDAAMTGDSGSYTVSATVTKAAATDSGAIADDGTTATVFSAGKVAEDALFSKEVSLASLPVDKTYQISAYAKNAIGAVTNVVGTAYNGTLTLTNVKDADEYKCVPGEVTVSRAAADPYPLTVNYTFTSATEGAAAGKTWVAPQPVVIPAGQVSATIRLIPIVDAAIAEDIVVTLSIQPGNYSAVAQTVDLTLKNLVVPEGYNAWVAPVAGKASVASNWSEGRVPNSTDKVLFDGDISNADCEWDGGVTGLATTVAEWKQLESYTGTITFDTTYTGDFKSLSVTGDVTLGGGTWTHLANTAAEEYRLKVVVVGNVIIGSAAKINASGKGFAKGQSRPGSAKGCHASPMGSAGLDKLYGDVKKPEALGSGSDKGAGGGAIYIEATGSFANEGQLNVNSFGGAAGSIFVKATSVSGTGAYYARAPESVDNSSYQAGSGGRIAFELTDSASITDDEAAFVNGKCATSFAFNGRNSAAGGTVLIKSISHANGILYVNGQTGVSYCYVRLQPEFKNMLAIPAGEAWTLDGIVFLNKPMAALKVPAGTTLSLPGGLASVKAYGSGGGIGGNGGHIATGNRGLVVDGGNLVLPAVEEHLIAYNWTFQSSQSFTLTGDVRVNAGGRIGVVAGYGVNYSMTNRCDLIISGNLNVETKGSIDATGAGWKNYKDTLPAGWGWTVNGECGAHGGVSSKHSGSVDYVYDSILNPMLPGEGAQNGDAGAAVFGGGCVKLTVSGKLTLNGAAHAKSNYQDVNAGAGGTINITCGNIEGSGLINVTTQSGYGGTQGGGGRVAIRLTGVDSDFTSYPLSRITVTQSGSESSGGTIYLQTAAESENCGTVYIKGDTGNTATCLTPFPSLAGGGENDDFSKAKIKIVNNGKVILSADAKVRELEMGNVGVMDFNGKVLTTGIATLIKSDGSASAKLTSGIYTAAQLNDLTGTTVYTDSVGGGKLVVTGATKAGLKIILR